MSHPHHTARRIFDSKWDNVQKVVRFRGERHRLPADVLEDVCQVAALILWKQALHRKAPQWLAFNCQVLYHPIFNPDIADGFDSFELLKSPFNIFMVIMALIHHC